MRLRTVLLAAVSLAFVAAPVAAATSKMTVKAHHKAPAKHRVVKAVPRGIAVRLDEVRIVTFNRPVATVFVGNPVVADATRLTSISIISSFSGRVSAPPT